MEIEEPETEQGSGWDEHLPSPAKNRETSAEGIRMTKPLFDIRRVLGEGVVMLPLTKAAKAPFRRGWQHTTLAETQQPDYQKLLAAGDVGILLGEPGGWHMYR